MKNEQLNEYKKKIYQLSEEEQKLRDDYLRKLATGEYQGPSLEYPEIAKTWLKFYDEDKISFDLPNQTVYEYAYEKNKDNLDNIALYCYTNDEVVTYREFFDKIREAEKSFLNMGIKAGDVVSFCAPTTPQTFYAFYALNKIGAIPNMIDPRTDPNNIKRFIKESNTKILFYVDVAYPKMAPIINELGIKNNVVLEMKPYVESNLRPLLKLKMVLGELKTKKIKQKVMSWEEFISNGIGYEGSAPEIKDKLNAPLGVVYTSGTTGTPKGSYMTNKNGLAMVYQNKCANMGWDRNDILLGIMPPFIAYGLICGFSLPICNGMQIDIISNFKSHKFAKYIKKLRPNHIMGVPSYLDSLTSSKELTDEEVQNIKSAIVGGDKMVISSEKACNEFFKKHGSNTVISKGYGMTEMSSNAIYTINNDCNELGSVGVPLIGNDIKILDENGKDLPFGEIGEVYLTGPTLINGYFNNEEETRKTFVTEDGKRWVNTKDKGYMTKDGVFHFCDRDKRIIIRSDGHNVWPSKIEQIIEAHPKIVKCCVTGVKLNPNENGEIPTAFIVVKKEDLRKIQKIINEVNKECLVHLPERDIALQYVVKEDLPLTPVGKIDYRSLSEEGVKDMKNKKMILAKK